MSVFFSSFTRYVHKCVFFLWKLVFFFSEHEVSNILWLQLKQITIPRVNTAVACVEKRVWERERERERFGEREIERKRERERMRWGELVLTPSFNHVWLYMAVSFHSWRNTFFLVLNQQPSVSNWQQSLMGFEPQRKEASSFKAKRLNHAATEAPERFSG